MTRIFNLGGTIALSYDDSGPVTLSGAELIGETDATLVDVDPVQSNALTWTHLIALRAELLCMSQSAERQAVVITGTDTVEDVANFLHLVAPPDVRIALLVSLHAAVRGQQAPGVGAALRWLRSGTDRAVQLFCDGEPYTVPFEKRWVGGEWEFLSGSPDPILAAWRVPASSRLNPIMPAIPVVAVGIGCESWAPQLIDLVPSVGLVLQAYGSGDVPPEVLPAIETYLAGGGWIVVASQSHRGLVEPTFPSIAGTSHGLLTAGCLSAGLLTAREARMRLALAVACDADDAPRRAFDLSSGPMTEGKGT